MAQEIVEPVLSWNLFLTMFLVPLSVSILYHYLKRMISRRDAEWMQKDEKIAKLLKEREEEKEQAIKEWRIRFQTTQCDIKKRVDQIAEGLHAKVDYEHCAKENRILEDRIHQLECQR